MITIGTRIEYLHQLKPSPGPLGGSQLNFQRRTGIVIEILPGRLGIKKDRGGKKIRIETSRATEVKDASR